MSFLAQRQRASAPWLDGRYPASSLLWAPPTPGQDGFHGYWFPLNFAKRFCFQSAALPGLPGSWAIPFTDAPPPYTPESPAAAHDHFFAADAGFNTFGRLATLIKIFRGRTGFACAAARQCASRGFKPRVAPRPAQSASCQMINLHGNLLSYCRERAGFSWRTKLNQSKFEVCLRAAILRDGGAAGAPAGMRMG